MATYYISPTGDDSTGDGSEGNPWLTLSHAYSSSITDDTIFLLNGTYAAETVNIVDRTLEGESVGGVIIDAGGGYYQYNFYGTCYVNKIRFTNFSASSGQLFYTREEGAGTYFYLCQFDNMFMGTTNAGSGIFYGRGGTQIISCVSCLFYDLRVTNGDRNLFMWYNGDTNDIFYCYNCTFALNETTTYPVLGIIYFRGTTYIKNNIFYTYDTDYKYSLGSVPVDSCDYCCIYGMSRTPSGTGNVTGDPLFMDASIHNFELGADSPCIFTGDIV